MLAYIVQSSISMLYGALDILCNSSHFDKLTKHLHKDNIGLILKIIGQNQFNICVINDLEKKI